jgi:hypothetical protein
MEMVGSSSEKTCWVSQSNPYTHSLYHMMIFDRNLGFFQAFAGGPGTCLYDFPAPDSAGKAAIKHMFLLSF